MAYSGELPRAESQYKPSGTFGDFFRLTVRPDEDRILLTGWKTYLLVGGLFLLSRAVVLLLFHLRGVPFPASDSGDQLALAAYLRDHGLLPTSSEFGFGRLFPGTAMLIAAIGPILGSLTLTGFIVSWSAGLFTVLLFHHLYQDLRTSILNVVFLPAWVANSTCVMSEGTSLGLCLLVIAATRLPIRSPNRSFALVVGGYSILCRNTAVFFVFPWLFGCFLKGRGRRVPHLLRDCLLVALPLLAYAGWAEATVGTVFPQLPLQAQEFKAWYERSGHLYPEQLLTWPGKSHFVGLFDWKYTRPIVKVINYGHLALMGLCAVGFARGFREPLVVDRPTAAEWLPLALVFGANLLFSLMIGNVFGHTLFYRYIASSMNPVIVLGLFAGLRLRWRWLFVLAIVSVGVAASTASDA